ncbi:MAG: hypothetical protein ACREOU_04595 [Candidatus Eiseniibacteriota bacterium]
MDSGYEQVPIDGGRVRFTVTPAQAPHARLVPLAAGVLVAIALFFVPLFRFGMVSPVSRLAVAAFALLAGRWVHGRAAGWLAARVDRARNPGGAFTVSPSAIDSTEAHIEREGLKRLVVRNVLRGSAGARAVSFTLCAETDGQTTTLAGGMTEETARGLLSDASRVLRLAPGPVVPV